VPTAEELAESDKRLLPKYISQTLPSFWNCYDRSLYSKVIDELKTQVKPEASPGVPLSRIALRNDKLFSYLGEQFNEMVLDRLELLMGTSLEDMKNMTRRECVERGFMDPVRVFVKNEPHKLSKIQTGKVRLIMSVSIIDKMIEMLLARHSCKRNIANWKTIPSKPGIGFSTDDNYHMCNQMQQILLDKEMCGSDIQGFDFTVEEWSIMDYAEMTIKLTTNYGSVDATATWAHVLRAKSLLQCKPIFQFSDGTLVSPNYLGIVCSGGYRTSDGNSIIRVRLADLLGAHEAMAAGDDCLEQKIANAKEKYLEYGYRLKAYDNINDSGGPDGQGRTFEFCSHLYSLDTYEAQPMNIEKMVMNLLHQTPKSFLEYKMFMVGFLDEVKNHPDCVTILQDLIDVGFYEVEGPHYIIPSDA